MKKLLMTLLLMISLAAFGQTITDDTFYYNRTSEGMESGTIHINYYMVEIERGTSRECYMFDKREYDGENELYTFTSDSGSTIKFLPSDHMLVVDNFAYYINSTIKSNWKKAKK